MVIYGNQNSINSLPVATHYDATVSASTEFTFNAAATLLQVSAVAKGLFFKWGTSDASSSAFDLVIPADQTYFLPILFETPGVLFTACNVIEVAATANAIVIEF